MSHEAADDDEPFQKNPQDEQAQPPPHLPTPRAFLTDLLSSLPGRTPPAVYDGRFDGAGNRARVTGPSTTSANPLRDLQGNDRNVFLTLHVLFPNELLPALDLLDRRLVTRFIVGDGAQTATVPAARGGDAGCDETAAAETIGRPAADDDAGIGGDREDDVVDPARLASAAAEATASCSHDNAEHQQGDAEHTTTRPPSTPPLPLYYVHSAQQQHRQQFHHYRHRSRYGHHHGHGSLLGDEDDTAPSAAEPAGAGNWYEVRLAAWNCSCPAFAFAAFPANLAEPSPSPGPGVMEGAAGMMEEWKEEAEGEQEKGGLPAGEDGGVGGDGGEGVWEQFGFGGLRRGGESGHVPPVCKHLLACLLVERAPGLFAGSVEERVVSVEEAAAWAAGWGG